MCFGGSYPENLFRGISLFSSCFWQSGRESPEIFSVLVGILCSWKWWLMERSRAVRAPVSLCLSRVLRLAKLIPVPGFMWLGFLFSASGVSQCGAVPFPTGFALVTLDGTQGWLRICHLCRGDQGHGVLQHLPSTECSVYAEIPSWGRTQNSWVIP